jgi:type I restriction enzyme S subunit
MKSEWQTKRLGDVAVVNAGNSAPQDESLFADGTYPFFRTKDAGRVRFGDIYESADYLNEKGVKGLRRFPKGTILFPKSGASTFLNHRVMLGVEGYVSSHLAAIVADEAAVEPRFLLYFLSTIAAQDLVQDHAYPSLNLPTISDITIHAPPLREQRRIVGLLDEAFAGLATAKTNAEKNLQNARALFESHLQSVFTHRGKGWMEKRLEEIGKTQTGSTPKTSDQANYGEFISFVKPADFNADGSLDYEKDGLSEKGLAFARIVPAGSVLMVCIGATIGKCGYCDQDVTTNQQINALTPTDGSSHRFLYYHMLTEDFQRSVIHRSGQATLPIINKSKWSALPVWLPPTVAEQKRIAAKFDALVDETQRLASLYERKLAALEELKKSLLHQAFTGQLNSGKS